MRRGPAGATFSREVLLVGRAVIMVLPRELITLKRGVPPVEAAVVDSLTPPGRTSTLFSPTLMVWGPVHAWLGRTAPRFWKRIAEAVGRLVGVLGAGGRGLDAAITTLATLPGT